MRDMKPILGRDPARVALANAIASESGARRDLQVAEQAAELAAERCWEAQSRIDELRKVVAAPSGARAAEFIASVGAGNPCNVATLERSSVAAGAQIAAAENDARVWEEPRRECDAAVRAKKADVSNAKERVEKAARVVVANSEMVTRLMDSIEATQAEVVERRVALQFVWGKGLNGELSRPDRDRIERLLRQDLTGSESHPVHGVWRAAFEELRSNSEAELPS